MPTPLMYPMLQDDEDLSSDEVSPQKRPRVHFPKDLATTFGSTPSAPPMAPPPSTPLERADEDRKRASTFRLKEAISARERLLAEEILRKQVSKKYKRLARVSDGLQAGLSATSVGLASSGLIISGTVAGLPVGFGLELAAIITAGLVLPSKFASMWLSRKVLKHESLAAIASANRTTVSRLVSEAIEDGHISSSELSHILQEVDTYEAAKAKHYKSPAVPTADADEVDLEVEARKLSDRFAELVATTRRAPRR